VRAGVPGDPVEQILLRVVGAVVCGWPVGTADRPRVRAPLYPNAGRQLVRVGHLEQLVDSVHQLAQIVARRRRRHRCYSPSRGGFRIRGRGATQHGDSRRDHRRRRHRDNVFGFSTSITIRGQHRWPSSNAVVI